MSTCLRATASLVLGILIIAGLFYLLVPVNILERLVTAEVYHDAVIEADAYNRVYDKELLEEALGGLDGGLLGDIEIDDDDQLVEFLRDVLRPAYLQEQTEDNIDRVTAYMRGETDTLEVYVELGEPLARFEPAVRAWVFRAISDLEIIEPTDSGCSADAMLRLSAAAAEPISRVADGNLPESAPSLMILTQGCREQNFDSWLDSLLSVPATPPWASSVLGEAQEELRQPFYEGDTRAFLRVAASVLVGPLAEDAIADIRGELRPNDRLYFIEVPGSPAGDEVDDQAVAAFRDSIGAARGPGKYVAILIVALGSVLLAAVHIPSPSAALRWPGVALVLGGTFGLLAGLVLNSVVPVLLRSAVNDVEINGSSVPTPAINLAADLMESLGRHATAGFVPWPVTVILLGAALIGASVFLNSLVPQVRKLRTTGRP